MDFEFIDEGDIEGVKRGRKSTVPAELVEALRTAPKGKALVLRQYAGDVTAADYPQHKARHGATIRSAGKSAGVKVSVVWSPAGVPQVTVAKK